MIPIESNVFRNLQSCLLSSNAASRLPRDTRLWPYQKAKQHHELSLPQHHIICRCVSHARFPRLNGFYPVTPSSDHQIRGLTCTLSDWSHPYQPKPHPCDAEAGKRCPRASHLPETHHHRTRRNRHPTTGISVPHIFLIDCAVSLGSLLFSRALSRLES